MTGSPPGSAPRSQRPRRTTPLPPLSRRALLRGAGGVAIALPFLEPMRAARAQARVEPKRLFTFLIENGVVPSAWFPTGTEKDFKMGSILTPMLPYQKHVIMPDGLDNKASGGTCHAAARAGVLTGQNNSGGRANGISIDQAVANQISQGTRLKSIEASVFLKRNFIYSLFHSGPGQAVFPEDDPAKVFERLFSTGVPTPVTPANPSPTVNEEFGRLRARKKSILDRALEEYKRLHVTVGASDQARLDRHMSGIREIERGLDALSNGGGALGASASCKLPPMPAPDTSDFQLHTKLQSELLSMALACDITRVGSLQTRASLTSFTWLGVNGGQHAISHQQGSPGPDAQLNKIATWFCEQVVYIIKQLQSYPTGDGKTLFDNTLLFWANDLGTGPHSRKRYPFLLATGEFTLPDGKLLETGRYLKYPGGTSHNDLLTSIGRLMGMPISNFGNGSNSKGPLPGLG
jgi:Protein of unknown function (DUF1552)